MHRGQTVRRHCVRPGAKLGKPLHDRHETLLRCDGKSSIQNILIKLRPSGHQQFEHLRAAGQNDDRIRGWEFAGVACALGAPASFRDVAAAPGAENFYRGFQPVPGPEGILLAAHGLDLRDNYLF